MAQSNKKVSAPGKIILSGEHAVVYGYPAIATAVNKRLSIQSNGEVYSDIPIGAGMGSSAALAVAMSALEVGELDLEEINKRAYKMEKKLHGNPSGVDNTVVTYGGYLWYRKEAENLKIFQNLKIIKKLPQLFLLNSGKPAESTAEMVAKVAESQKKNPVKLKKIFSEMEKVTRSFAKLITGENSYDLGELIAENQKLLEKIGVVSKSTKSLIGLLENNGFKAKISGAGGYNKDSGILIIYAKSPSNLLKFAKSKNLDVFGVKLGQPGVTYEEN